MGVSTFPFYTMVDLADAKNTFNEIIQWLNRNYSFYGGINNNEFTTLATLRYWLANNGSPAFIYQVDNAVPVDVASPIAILWQGDGVVVKGDPLYQFIFGLGIVVPPLGTLTDPSVPPAVTPFPFPSDYVPIIDV